MSTAFRAVWGCDSDCTRYAKKVQVERVNESRLRDLETPLREFASFDTAGLDSRGNRITVEQATSLLDRNTLWLSLLKLKVGAQVMLITVRSELSLRRRQMLMML